MTFLCVCKRESENVCILCTYRPRVFVDVAVAVVVFPVRRFFVYLPVTIVVYPVSVTPLIIVMSTSFG